MLWTGLGWIWEGRWPAAGHAVAPSGGGRCGPISGEVEAGDSGWGGSAACVGARVGEGRFTSARGWPELELPAAAWPGRRWTALVRRGGPARRGQGQRPLK
jgi:hypothetical protein